MQRPPRVARGFDLRAPFGSFYRATRDMISEPEAFFRDTRGGTTRGSTLYLLVAMLALGLVYTLFLAPFALLIGVPVAQDRGIGATAGVLALVVAGVVAVFLVLVPLLLVVSVFVGACFWHPFVALAVGVGRNGGFRETYRISAYANGITQLASLPASFVPIVGPFLAAALGIYVMIFGVKGAHGASTARAVVSVVIPLAIGLVLLVAAVAGLLYFLDGQGAFDGPTGFS